MKTIQVNLPKSQYEIFIGAGLILEAANKITPILNRNFVAIVSDANVAALYGEKLEKVFHDAGIESVLITVPAGEGSKSWPYLTQVVEELLEAKVERDDVVIALGGGVIGDLVGFAASILRRGVRFVQMPTSLLAQVDSSVGGKTGINSKMGKNLIGAFHQPEMVICDTDVLKTLPKREFLSGYGEVVKYGLLGDAQFFEWLDENHNSILGLEQETIETMIAHCCQMKADIVARDEKERGDRALLNLGHTFGHALESATGYSSRLLHGEGVAIGCGLAFDLSEKLNHTTNMGGKKARAHFEKMGMMSKLCDVEGVNWDIDQLVEAMKQDKKVQSGKLTFILAHEIGKAFVARSIDDSVVKQVLKEALS